MTSDRHKWTRWIIGIAKLATPFYPHPAIVRLSDFKTNEYASLIGGKTFEAAVCQKSPCRQRLSEISARPLNGKASQRKTQAFF